MWQQILSVRYKYNLLVKRTWTYSKQNSDLRIKNQNKKQKKKGLLV